MSIGAAEVLCTLRKETGESQAQVAKAVGVTTSAYSMYERGERIPRDGVKRRIADHFHVQVQEIFFR